MTLSHDDAIALAAGLTGALGVPLAAAAFFAERVLSAGRRQVTTKIGALAGLLIAGLYTASAAVLAWWAWTQALGHRVDFIWGVSRSLGLAVLFTPPLLFSLACALGGLIGLVAALVGKLRSSSP